MGHIAVFCIILLFMAQSVVGEEEAELPVYIGCGHDIRGVSEGIIDYPNNRGGWYRTNQDCKWNIIVQEGYKIKLTFERLLLNRITDSVTIKNGESGTTIDTFTQAKLKEVIFTTLSVESEANEIFLHFQSDNKYNKKGFKVTWKRIFNEDISNNEFQILKEMMFNLTMNQIDLALKVDSQIKTEGTLEEKLARLEQQFQSLQSNISTSLSIVNSNLENQEDSMDQQIQSLKRNINTSFSNVNSKLENQEDSLEQQLQSLESNINTSLSNVNSKLENQGCPEGLFLFAPSDQCYLMLNDKLRSWDNAKFACSALGLQLAHPYEAVALRKFLVTKYGSAFLLWLNGRGDGSAFRWQDTEQTALSNNNPLWLTGPGSSVTTSHCLLLVTDEIWWKNHPNTPYYSELCNKHAYALCEHTTPVIPITFTTTEVPTTEAPTTEISTTEPPGCPEGYFEEDVYSSSPNQKCYRVLKWQRFTWDEAKHWCNIEGLQLAHPHDDDAIKLRRTVLYHATTVGTHKVTWLNGRGDGSHMVWQDTGEAISWNNPLWNSDLVHDGSGETSLCLGFLTTTSSSRDPRTPIYSEPCNSRLYALCELVRGSSVWNALNKK